MSERYRVEVVTFESVSSIANKLATCMNSIGYNERVKQIVPLAQGAGYTGQYLVVIEPLSFHGPT